MGRAILNALIVAVVAIAVFGLLGAVGLLLGRVSQLGFFGTFIGSIGELIRLAMPLVAGIAGAFTLSSIGTALTRDALKTVSVNMSHVLGAILGALSGAVVLGVVAFLGTKAAWLGLLTPVFAAGLGGAILPQLYRRFVPKPLEPSHSDSLTMTVLGWLGSIVAFLITYSLLNVQRAVVEGALPSSRTAFTVAGLEVSSYLFEALLIGLVLGGLAGGLAGTRSNFPIGQVLYTGTRTLLNAIRSIEPLIMGLVFVIWVGIGPFAGVLALALHSVASLGKLYSEQVENIDTGPIEALQSTGANRLQTIMYAVVPQIIPPYIAFTMYRWDINVRMSTIIGFVGGGGIGFLLQQQINLLRYRDAGVAVLAIAIVVSVLDYASAFIRERYT
ncbi:MAG: ABC transporter permease subunit [Anaerolineae bacterium]|nr:ABC transporter permease subunit [Anaerolineae bacterium]